jgi:hypothetical protein
VMHLVAGTATHTLQTRCGVWWDCQRQSSSHLAGTAASGGVWLLGA